MTTETVLPIDREAIKAWSRDRNEPEWLTGFRLEALEATGRLELPRLEKTKIGRWTLNHYGAFNEPEPVHDINQLPEQASALLGREEPDNLLIQRNSGVLFERLAASLAEQGVIFTGLDKAVREHGELVRKYFMQAVKKDENRITALHTALWSGGVFLYVPKNVQVNVPLQALFMTDDDQSIFSPHVLIVAEANSSVTYIDNVISEGGSRVRVHNGITEVFAAPGAQVRYATVHSLQQSVTDLSYRRAILENDAKVQWIIGEMNDGHCMSDTASVLRGNGAASDAKVVCIGAGEQELNITTRAAHFGKSTDSDMVTRAVMRDKADAIINGVTKIEKGALNANGEQTEKVLMLSPGARGDANPMLLIDEDEVTAGHAASVGQVDKEQVFYLMSRGVSRQDAERLIIYGFLTPIVASLPIERLAENLQRLIVRKLQR